MSRSTYNRRASVGLAGLLAAVTVLAGCGSSGGGSGGTPASTASTASSGAATTTPVASTPAAPAMTLPASPAAMWPCLRGHGGSLALAAPDQPIVSIGGGSRVVVASDQSDEDVCGWVPVLPALQHAGLRVVLYDYAGDPVQSLTKVLAYEHAHGANSVGLLGASEGAKTAIVAGATASPPVAAVISLSAEYALGGKQVGPYAQRLHAPTLYLTSAEDPYGATDATRGYYRSSPAKPKQLVVVPGGAHGTELLAASKIRSQVVAFLAAHDR